MATCATPPSSVPIAIPAIGGRPTSGMSGTTANAQKMVATLNIAGESDGMKKRCSEFSMPISATATATVVRNGSMIRVSCVVSSSFPGTAANSAPAIARVIGSANTMPSTTRMVVISSSALMTRLPRRQAASRPREASVRVNVGTKAAVIAPSAKRSRTRLGMRKATLNASIAGPVLAPKRAATTISRTTPSTRLASVARLMRPAERASPPFADMEEVDCGRVEAATSPSVVLPSDVIACCQRTTGS